LAVAGSVVVVDQVSKVWALSALSEGQVVSLLGRLLRLRLVYNPGAAFSVGEQVTWLFTAISLGVCVALLVVLRGGVSNLGWAVALGGLLGGAVGNLIDRLFRPPAVGRGHVIDFLDYYGLFVGNVADIAIVGAAMGLVVLSLRNVPMRAPA
jgi:signal peptidase II